MSSTHTAGEPAVLTDRDRDARRQSKDGRCRSSFSRSATGPRGVPARPRRPRHGSRRGPAPPLWRLMVTHPSGSLEARRRRVRAPQPGRQLQHPRRARRQHGPARADDEAGAAAGAAADGVRRDGVARAAHAARGDPIGGRQPRRRRRRRRAAQVRRYGELMRAEGRRLTEMVEQILEFAGIQSGQRGLRAAPGADPTADRRHVVPRRRRSSSGPASRSRSTSAGDLPPVLGDEPALRRVFQNLVDNAIKYGALRRLDADRARGSGPRRADRRSPIAASASMPAEQSRIFEPFYRAADVVAAQMQGAGLGLSLVQRIVARTAAASPSTARRGRAASSPSTCRRRRRRARNARRRRRRCHRAPARRPRYS